MKIKTRVLVVGGGPAGSAAARVLAKKGIDTLLLEKKLSFAKPCCGGVPYFAFEEFNIPKEQIKRKIDRIKIVSPNNNVVEIDLKPLTLFIVDRNTFDAFLRKKAESHGAGILEGEFKNIEKRKNLFFSNAVIGRENIEIQSEYIIAADGINSKVRLVCGIKPQKAVFTISEKIDDVISDECEFWFSSSHAHKFYSWVFPAAEGISIGTGALEPKQLKHSIGIFKKRRKVDFFKGRSKIYRIPIWTGDLYNRGNIIFAGDSAGQVMPLSYEGIYYAMKSGEFAAEAVIKGKAELYEKIWKNKLFKNFFSCQNLTLIFSGMTKTLKGLFPFTAGLKSGKKPKPSGC